LPVAKEFHVKHNIARVVATTHQAFGASAQPTEAQRIAALSPRRQAQITHYKAQPVARVARPLRYVFERNMAVETDAKGNKQHVPNAKARRARIAARRGQGHIVQAMALVEASK
jgi:hypothetical protein